MFYFLPIATAFAEEAAAAGAEQPPGILGMLPLVFLFAIFYFLLIRPQQKKAKQHKEMLSKIEKGDNIITNGGLHGRVTGVNNDAITVEISDNVRVKVSTNAVAHRVTKEESK